MEIINVLVAAAASYAFGAVWYMTLANPWMEAAGVERDADGKPANAGDPTPVIISGVASIVVAGMMRHMFSLSGIDTPAKGIVAELGVGLFLVLPWIATNYGFAGRSRRLILIDGGYATGGCTIMGLVLTLF